MHHFSRAIGAAFVYPLNWNITMRNVRSYLSAQEVREIQPHTYCRLNTTVGGTYGSSYKRRYGTVGRGVQAPALPEGNLTQVAPDQVTQSQAA